MGLIRGTGNFTRYFVNNNPDQNDPDVFLERITRYSFQKLDENSEEERSTGWVNIMDVFNADFEDKAFFMHPYIALSWRVDVRKVPRDALKQHCQEAENEIKKSEELEQLPKNKRKELRDFIWHQLLKRSIPRIHTYDMIWNLDTSILFFGSTNNKLCDEFAESFSRTFDIGLSPLFPYSMAYHYLEKDRINPELLDAIKETDFTGGNK